MLQEDLAGNAQNCDADEFDADEELVLDWKGLSAETGCPRCATQSSDAFILNACAHCLALLLHTGQRIFVRF